MNVWDQIAQYRLPIVYLHQHSGQPPACLEGLVDYAAHITLNKHTYAFRSPRQILTWLWLQKVVLDSGEGPKSLGCSPRQRARVWPDDGLNCWEAVAHLLAVAFSNRWSIEFHIFDAKVGVQRHVFPAIRPLNSFDELPQALVIQPPLLKSRNTGSLKKAAAQAWYNDLLGAVHIVGDKVLRVYGAGEVSDMLADVESDELPDWARTAKQKEKRAADLIKLAMKSSEKKTEKTIEEADTPKTKKEGQKEGPEISKSDLAKWLKIIDMIDTSDKLPKRQRPDGGETTS